MWRLKLHTVWKKITRLSVIYNPISLKELLIKKIQFLSNNTEKLFEKFWTVVKNKRGIIFIDSVDMMRRTLGNGYDLPPQQPLPKHLWWSNCPISQMRKPMVLRGKALEQVRGRAGTGSQVATSHATHIHRYNWSYSLSTQPCEQPGFGDLSVLQHPEPHKWAWGVQTTDSFICGLGPGSLTATPLPPPPRPF